MLFPKSLDQKGSTNLLTKYKESIINSVPNFACSCPLPVAVPLPAQGPSIRAASQKKKNVAAVTPIKVKMDFEPLQATDANHIRLHCNRFLVFWTLVALDDFCLPKNEKAEKMLLFYLSYIQYIPFGICSGSMFPFLGDFLQDSRGLAGIVDPHNDAQFT